MSSPLREPAPAEDVAQWHALRASEAGDRLGSSVSAGLAEAQAESRLRVHGRNALGEQRKPDSFVEELLESFTEPLQLLLIAVAVLSAIFGELRDAVAIAAIIGAVAVVETVTETRSAKSIDALHQLAAPSARVRRDGRTRELPAVELVPGDLVELEAGDVVPADLRVVAASGLRVDESTLTGEPAPVGKGAAPVGEEAALAERTSMLFTGTVVVAGSGRALAVATGPLSELGRLGRLVADERPGPTPMQRGLNELARTILVIAVVVSAGVPLVGIAAGQPAKDMLLAGLTLAFATVPEELPILITVLLAVAGRQLARRGALLRTLSAAETLGAVTVVVTDKTGTLTANELRVDDLYVAAGTTREGLLETAVRTHAPDGPNAREPLETSLAAFAEQAGVTVRGTEVASYPFDPNSKLVSRAWRLEDGQVVLAVGGAPEAVLARCDLSVEEQSRWAGEIARYTGAGLRLVAFADRSLAGGSSASGARGDLETGLFIRGLAVFVDPLRPGVAEAVRTLREGGVATLVLTGDHPRTATAIARDAGLPDGEVLLGGVVLDQCEDAELSGRLRHGTVIARATPTDKLRIVRLLQARHDVVAVTGDGVNDAPALAAADVGIAMGRRGSELARQAAGVVLTDDAYSTVAAAIAAGRNVRSQLRRAVGFYLGAKVALVACMLTPLLLGRPAPFTPVMIVLLELFMDLGASVAFVAEPANASVMRQGPPDPRGRFLDRIEVTTIGAVAVALTIAVLPAYLLASSGTSHARSAALLAWLAAHALIAWSVRGNALTRLRANIAFPVWAALAVATGAAISLTPAAGLLGLDALTADAALLVSGCVAAGAAMAAILRRAAHLERL